MDIQVQCPNCGGFVVRTEIRKVNPRTLKEYSKLGCLLRGLGAYLIVCGIGTVISFIIFLPAILKNPIYLLLIIIPLLTGSIGLLIFKSQSIPGRDALNRYYCCCQLCGNNWNWLEGEPLPMVHVRPDLIQRGAEYQRRQAEAAAAAQYEDERWRRQNRH